MSARSYIFLGLALYTIFMIGPACTKPQKPVPFVRWQSGFWVWWQASYSRETIEPDDILFIQTGAVSETGKIETRPLPDLPRADSIVAVWRFERAASPPLELIPQIVSRHMRLVEETRKRGIRISGLQVDADVPTEHLDDYARFLSSLRPSLQGQTISVTAILDWFRKGTAISRVVEAVDEYVPQFYDASPAASPPRITEPLNPVLRERFESLGRPFRIGLATFGRIYRLRPRANRIAYRDVTPLEVLKAGKGPIESTLLTSGDRYLRFGVTENHVLPETRPGDEIEILLPGTEGLARAITAARQMGPLCAGVVFFRWPQRNEALVLTPGEVRQIAAGEPLPASPELLSNTARCAGRACADLFLHNKSRLNDRELRVRIRSNQPLTHFAADSPLALRFSGDSEFEVTIPAFARDLVIPLGRAFTRFPANYEVTVLTP